MQLLQLSWMLEHNNLSLSLSLLKKSVQLLSCQPTILVLKTSSSCSLTILWLMIFTSINLPWQHILAGRMYSHCFVFGSLSRLLYKSQDGFKRAAFQMARWKSSRNDWSIQKLQMKIEVEKKTRATPDGEVNNSSKLFTFVPCYPLALLLEIIVLTGFR